MGDLYRRLAARATPTALRTGQEKERHDAALHLLGQEETRGTAPTSAPSLVFCALLAVLAERGSAREVDWKGEAGVAWSTVNHIGERMLAMGVVERDVATQRPKHGIHPVRRVTFTITETGRRLAAELSAEGALPSTSGSPP